MASDYVLNQWTKIDEIDIFICYLASQWPPLSQPHSHGVNHSV